MKYLTVAFCWLFLSGSFALAQDTPKPKVAVFPLGGSSPQALRDRIGSSVRTKLDRDGAYDVIDGPEMSDLAATAKSPLTADSDFAAIKDIADGSGAVLLIWGDASPADGKALLRLKVADLRAKDSPVRGFQSAIADAVDARFAIEKFLDTLPGVAKPVRPNEEAVHHDATSDALFAVNPNLVIDGDFSRAGHWTAILESDQYRVAASDAPPDPDKVCINSLGPHDGNALAMNLTLHCAQSNGLACLSDPIPIQHGVRYRISFQYRSDGPATHVFVKGYTSGKSLAGGDEDQEVYRLQVPPGTATGDKWVTVEADMSPQNPSFPVERLRLDLYGYLNAGTVSFKDVELKAVGKQ